MRIIKNDGRLAMEYEGKSGGRASLVFEGLNMIHKGKMYAIASTQTSTAIMKEHGIQTEGVKFKQEAVQMEAFTMKNIGIQTEMIMTKEVQEAAESSHSIDKETQTKSSEQSSTSFNADIHELSPVVPGRKRKWTSPLSYRTKRHGAHGIAGRGQGTYTWSAIE